MPEAQEAPPVESPVPPANPPPADPPGDAPAAAPSPEAPAPAPNSADPAPPADGGGATLAEDTATEEPVVTAPADFPDNWRQILAGGDAKALSKLNRYASPANIWKALGAAQQKITSGELISAKPDGTDENAMNEWRASVGIPEKPEGYLEKLPDGLVIGEDDKPIVDSFIQAMHEDDMPPDHVHKFLGWYNGFKEQQIVEQAEEDKKGKATNEDTLRAEWGPEFRPNLNGVHAMLSQHGAEGLSEKFFGARLPDGSPLGNDPDALKFLVSVSREINPRGIITPHEGQTAMQTITDELTTLRAEMADTKAREPGGYWSNDGKQERYRELLELEDKYKTRAA